MKFVIIGAGIAGVTAAQTIKERMSDVDVVVIGEEQYFPYRRHLLTEFLCENVDEKKIYYDSKETFRKHGIKLRKGEYVKSIDPSNKSIKLVHNEVMQYDKLLIATGGCPTPGPVLKPFVRQIFRYYSLQDIMVLKRMLPKIKHCIVSGEGVSSLDLMSALRRLGKKVTYITNLPRADFPIIESEFEGELHEFLESKDIDIITKDRIISVEEEGTQYRVFTLDQKELTADLVFAWDYYLPNIEVIDGTGIEKKLGILVNDELKTNIDDIYAAGDCVEIYHPQIKDYWINFGWSNAVEQGKIAGKNMTGEGETYQVNDAIAFNLMGKPLKARWWE